MACSYVWNKRYVVKTFDGFVSGVDFIRSTEAVAADSRFDQLQVIYNNFLGIEGHSVDAAAYRRVDACRRGALRSNPNFRVVFIAAGRFYGELAGAIHGSDQSLPFHPRMCRTFEAGYQWFASQPMLDIPRPSL